MFSRYNVLISQLSYRFDDLGFVKRWQRHRHLERHTYFRTGFQDT